jgi:hypothetical protein
VVPVPTDLHTTEDLFRKLLAVERGQCASDPSCVDWDRHRVTEAVIALLDDSEKSVCGLQLPSDEPCTATAVYFLAKTLV